MANKNSRYAKAKGRSDRQTGRFARLPHTLLESGAYRALSPNARALLNELTMMENGQNNGALFLSVRDAADRMGLSDAHAAGHAFHELEEMGFLACTAEAHFAVKTGAGSRARAWRLTWLPVPAKRGSTNDFLMCEPAPKTRARGRMLAGQKALKRWRRAQSENEIAVVDLGTHDVERVRVSTTTTSEEDPQTPRCVQKSSTRFPTIDGKQPIAVVLISHTHTADHAVSSAPTQPNKQSGLILASGPDCHRRNGDSQS